MTVPEVSDVWAIGDAAATPPRPIALLTPAASAPGAADFRGAGVRAFQLAVDDQAVAQALSRACAWVANRIADRERAHAAPLVAAPLGVLLAGTLQRLLVAHGVAPEDGAVDAALGRRLIDQTLVHAAEIVLAAEASPAAQRRWPPRELVAPESKLAGWWDRPRQQTLIASLAAVRARQGALLRQGAGG